MKAVYMEKPWSIAIKDIAEPVPKGGEAVIKLHAAGICGSDIGAFRGVNNLVSYPRVIGHELSAEIISVPENNKKGLKPGDHVVVDPYIFCGKCYPCSIGRTNCCDNLKVLGVQTEGGMSETFAHPADLLVKIPDDMAWEDAALAEPLTISLHCIHRLRLKAGEHVAIFGAGPIGLLAAMAAIEYGATPILIDLVEERLNLAASSGVKYLINLKTDDLMEKIREYTNGMLCECVLEASGANSAIRSTLDVVCHAGRIAFTGWPHSETALPTDLFTKKEIDLLGSRTSAGEFEEAVDLIYNKKIDVSKLVTKTVSIDDAPQAVRDLEKYPEQYMKITVVF